MQISSIQNQQNFTGKVIVDSLSRKQQKVYEKIEPLVVDMFKDKNYNLFITGNTKPDLNCIHVESGIIPRYVNFATLPDNSKLTPSVGSFSGSFNPDMWLMHVRNLIERHEKSTGYEMAHPKTSTVQKFKNFIKNLFNPKK